MGKVLHTAYLDVLADGTFTGRPNTVSGAYGYIDSFWQAYTNYPPSYRIQIAEKCPKCGHCPNCCTKEEAPK